jgi:signal transduction histidine kinase
MNAPERPEQSSAHREERSTDAVRSVEESRDRFAFLAEVSRCLAESLDYETTLTTVASMSLPYLGAWCIVDVVEEDSGIRRLAVLHPDATKQGTARELYSKYPPHSDDLIGASRVIRTRRPEMVFDVPDEALIATARDTEHLDLLRALGTKAYVIVPMVARDRVLGAITFVTADARRRFGDIDVVIAEDLARRAAMALDNARLHRQAERARQEAALARDEAEAAAKSRGEFVAMVSHEVRTPLNAIVGYAQLLELELSGALTDTQRSYVQRLRDSGRHLVRLVDDVLDLSKSEAGRLAVASDVIPAADTVRAALSVVSPVAAGKLVVLSAECAGADLHYVGDEHRVRQILVNLLGNAIKFTRPGGRVTLDCVRREDQGDWVQFRVRDTGQGVAAEKAQTIFEPFEQGEAGLTRPGGGTGLGLAISRRLARLMGGDVTLEQSSDSNDVGAAFTLHLSAARPDQIAVARPKARSTKGSAAAATTPAHGDATAVARTGELAAARRGLEDAGVALLEEIGAVTREIVERVRADRRLSVSEAVTDVEVADHSATLLTDIANSLVVLGEASGEPTEALADGAKIQRLIGELHGAQRQRLGWTEEQLIHEMAIVRDVCAAAISRVVGEDPRAGEAAAVALSRLLEERRRACLVGFRAAAA